MIWRLVTSQEIRASLSELKSAWTIDDLMQAHDVLDAFEELKQDGNS